MKVGATRKLQCLRWFKLPQQFDLGFQLDPELLRHERVYLVHQGHHIGGRGRPGVHDVIGMDLRNLGTPDLQPFATCKVDQPAGVVTRGIAKDAPGAGRTDRLAGGAMREPLLRAPPDDLGRSPD